MPQSKLWILDLDSVRCLFDTGSSRWATSRPAGRFLPSLVNCNTWKSYVAHPLFGEFSSEGLPPMRAEHLRIFSPWDGWPVKFKSGWVFSWLRCLIPSVTRLPIQRTRISPESVNMSDILSPAVSDSQAYEDDSEVESQGRNRLGKDWLKFPESVLFDDVLEIWEVSSPFGTRCHYPHPSRKMLDLLPGGYAYVLYMHQDHGPNYARHLGWDSWPLSMAECFVICHIDHSNNTPSLQMGCRVLDLKEAMFSVIDCSRWRHNSSYIMVGRHAYLASSDLHPWCRVCSGSDNGAQFCKLLLTTHRCHRNPTWENTYR